MGQWSVMLGFDAEYRIPIFVDFFKTGHLCVVGGTGSGKSIAVLYFLYKLFDLSLPLELYIGDFKKSGDYAGLSPNFAEFDTVVDLIDQFYNIVESTPEGYDGLKILILDEYASFSIWLAQQDKKRSDAIKIKIANLLMMGRSKHCFIWSVQQRISASLYPTGVGAIDNFQICIGLGRLSPDSRKSLFAGEWADNTLFMQSYQPKTGQGLILIDGQSIRPFAVPYISDKNRLITVCKKKIYSK